jgi:hypothetical protein
MPRRAGLEDRFPDARAELARRFAGAQLTGLILAGMVDGRAVGVTLGEVPLSALGLYRAREARPPTLAEQIAAALDELVEEYAATWPELVPCQPVA